MSQGWSNSSNHLSSGAITQATTHFASAAYALNGELCWTSASNVGSPSCGSTPTGATTFSYDLNGNRTASSSTAGATALSWQATSGRLTCINTAGSTCSATSPTSTTTLYSYDGEGHRMTSANNGTTTAFIWDTSASQLLADSTHDYVYLQGSVTPDLQINLTSGTVDLLIQDQNANTRAVVQVTGANTSLNNTLVNYSDYDAYGNAITESGGSINPGGMANGGVTTDISTSFAFGAGYWDSSNLTYLVHRYLDNETGQFISVDPLLDQTREAYVYAGDGPSFTFDNQGLRPAPTALIHYFKPSKPLTWEQWIGVGVTVLSLFGPDEMGIGEAVTFGIDSWAARSAAVQAEKIAVRDWASSSASLGDISAEGMSQVTINRLVGNHFEAYLKDKLTSQGFSNLERGVAQSTSKGKRFLDIYDSTASHAWECKVGNLKWNSRIKLQIEKDAELLSGSNSKVSKITWVLARNPLTGIAKADSKVIEELHSHGIKLEFAQ